MKKRTLWAAALVLLLALVLASCGGGGQGGGGGGSQTTAGKKATTGGEASGGAIKTVTIKESEFKLSPSRVTLSKPGAYSFKAENDGSVQHSLEIEGKGLKNAGAPHPLRSC
jgi:hypothetical protein